MDNLVTEVTKGIKDLLEKNEKRFSSQQSSQETLAKLLDDLTVKYERLELRCQEIEADKVNLKSELQQSKKREEETANVIVKLELESKNREERTNQDFVKLKSEFKDHLIRLKDFEKWVEVTSFIASSFTSINESRVNFDEKLKELDEKLNETAKQVRRCQQQQTNSISYRTPVKSPSTPSYLSVMHDSLTRSHQSKSHFSHRNRPSMEHFDADEELNVLSDHTDKLRREVEMINDLQHSFEKSSSIYSND